ncbi:histidine phosphatase family protein [Paenibacillus sp. N1-5-1-14]|uniref:histidine phosphatase family protein n=1 Tax=Paenibacillus radicibacter TaxID=2972488 RepID=UPI0021591936|nr:histidine phosphatase family protein [Paenibacillus radicibacter]MCR8642004.1 histidine phosphatase family protein [Paenibacillus radicibacter]
MTTTIGLIRHGITQWNELGKAQGISDISLNETGFKQARELATRVSGEHWDLVYSSKLNRAFQTAEVVSTSLRIQPILIDDRLREINCGLVEGTTEEERIEKWGANWRSRSLGMESYEDVGRRGIDFIKEVSVKHAGKRILIVSHGALIGLTLQHLLPDVFIKTYIDNTSITILQLRDEVWECVLYNCTKHLSVFG